MKEKSEEMNIQLKRRRRLHGYPKGLSTMEPADLSIIYAKDGWEWEQYLDTCFRQLIHQGNNHRPLHIHTEKLEKLTLPLLSTKIDYISKSKAQLVILTPEFLDYVQENRGMLMGQMFDPTRVVAMLCGVDTRDVEDIHRAELVTFPSWQAMPVMDQDQNFVWQLIRKTVEIIETSEESEVKLKPKFKLTPRKVKEGSNKVYALLNSAITSEQEIKIYIKNNDDSSTEILAKKRNPYTVQFLIPENLLVTSQIISIHVTCDGVSLGIRQLKCDSKMGELHHLLGSVRDPMAFLCQTLGLTVNMTKELDILLANSFKKNMVDGLQVLECNRDIYSRKTDEEMPTVLHFAAQFGLRELCSLLLDCPGAKIACNIRNASGYCPAEIAEIAGHLDLAQMLENFTNLTVTKDLYTIITSVTDETDSQKIYDSLYDYPKSIPLYDCPSSIPIPIPSVEKEEGDYLPMSSSGSIAYLPHERLLLGFDNTENDYQVPPKINVEAPDPAGFNELNPISCRFQGYTNSQVELLELLEDFKTNKVSLNEVEQLFEDWKVRQSHQSFKEKEHQLASMRAKYEQIQQNAPEKNQRAFSLMEKIINLLPNKVGKKSNVSQKQAKYSTALKKNDIELVEDTNLRPISTLSTTSVISSISSSSSSDRLSTISSVSNYDSGAQSDSGDDSLRSKGDNVEIQLQKTIERKKLSCFISEECIRHMGLPISTPQLPSPVAHSQVCKDTSLPRPIPPRVPNKPSALSPSFQKRVERLSNIEERKPMPPPRPDRMLTPRNSFNNEIRDYQNVSSDYVIPDPDLAVYQTPMTPPRSIYDTSGKTFINKVPLMPAKRFATESCTKKLSPVKTTIPDYVNLSKEDIQIISQQYTKTKHHDYYNWSSGDKHMQRETTVSQKITKVISGSNESTESSITSHEAQLNKLSSSNSPKMSYLNSLPSMKGRPLPDRPSKTVENQP